MFYVSLAQTPGPDLAWQEAVMQSEAFIISENSCIPTSRRARAGWLAITELYSSHFQSNTTTSFCCGQVAPGRARKHPGPHQLFFLQCVLPFQIRVVKLISILCVLVPLWQPEQLQKTYKIAFICTAR
jgi:hypothetical protein